MAFTGHDMTALANGFMIKFDSVYEKFIYNKSKMAKAVKAKARKGTLGGRSGEVRWGVKNGAAYAVGAHAEAGDFGTPRPSVHKNYQLTGANYNFPGEFSGDVLDYARDRSAAYIGEALSEVQDDILSSMQHFLATRFYMNGDGIMGQIAGVPATNVVTVDGHGVRLMRENMKMTAHAAATGSATDTFTNGTILDRDAIAGTITVTDDGTAADNHFLFVEGTYDKPEMNGLRSLFDATATVQGLDRTLAGNRFSIPFIFDKAAAALTETGVTEVTNAVQDYAYNVESIPMITGNNELINILYDLVKANWRFAEKGSVKVGFGDVAIYTPTGVVTVMSDPFCHPLDLYFLTPSEFALYTPKGREGGYWYAPSGNTVQAKPGASNSGYADAYQVIRIWRGNLAIDDFSAHAVLRNFT